jgi:hypothetical protein
MVLSRCSQQVLIVEFGDLAFDTVPLSWDLWLWCCLFGVLSWPVQLIINVIARLAPHEVPAPCRRKAKLEEEEEEEEAGVGYPAVSMAGLPPTTPQAPEAAPPRGEWMACKHRVRSYRRSVVIH